MEVICQVSFYPKLGVALSGIFVAVGATGLYVVGGDDSSTTMGKYDASGNELWSRQLPRFVGPPMTVDDGVYFVNNGPDPFLRKYDASGNELWNRPVGAIPRALATGGGERDPAVADGQILSDVLPRISLGLSAWFDNGPQYDFNAYGEVLYAGGSPGSVAGLLQLNVRVPPDALARKAVAFGLAIGASRAAGSLTIALR